MTKKAKNILITGACGQIGTDLTQELRERYGQENVLATDIKTDVPPEIKNTGPYQILDVTDVKGLKQTIIKNKIDTIYHMSAILSAIGEKKPQFAWNVNMTGTYNILETAQELKVKKVFVPSSIAVFGPETPKKNTPQETILLPQTIYGVTKVAGELLSEYFVRRFGLDVRGCRYPGIISHKTLPGGGTTDYAVAIFYEAIKYKKYTCFVSENTRLPMMYMPDCLKATLNLMDADFSRLKHHACFNISGMSFTAGELAAEIKKHIPEFKCTFKPDDRQKIADSWPSTIDDSAARSEWGWNPDYDLESMTSEMLSILTKRHQQGKLNY